MPKTVTRSLILLLLAMLIPIPNPASSLAASLAQEEIPLIQGWYKGRETFYYDLGSNSRAIADGGAVITAPVYLLVTGFDADNNPQPVQGQYPIFDVLPDDRGYSDLRLIVYVTVPQGYTANNFTSADDFLSLGLEQTIPGRLVNYPIVAADTELAADGTSLLQGWHENDAVYYFDFGPNIANTTPLYQFARGFEGDGSPQLVEGQYPVVGSVPGDQGYSAFRNLHVVLVPEGYGTNSIRSVEQLENAEYQIIETGQIMNAPITRTEEPEIAPTPTNTRVLPLTPTPTEEPTEEATPEPTEEVISEPTEEVTVEPTEEATEEATEEPTEEAATTEPTQETTEEPTEELMQATEEPSSATPLPTTASTEETISSQANVSCRETYIVQVDDWLSTLADKFLGDISAYPIIFEVTNAKAAVNDTYDSIADPDLIEVGQALCIPTGEEAEEILADEIIPEETPTSTTEVAAAIAGDIPIEKSLLVFSNHTGFDLGLDIEGATTDFLTIAPDTEPHGVLNPGSHTFIVTQMGGGFSQHGQFDVVAGEAVLIVCSPQSCQAKPYTEETAEQMATATLPPPATATPTPVVPTATPTPTPNPLAPASGQSRVFLKNDFNEDAFFDIGGQRQLVTSNSQEVMELAPGTYTWVVTAPSGAGSGRIDLIADQSWVIFVNAQGGIGISQVYP